MKTIPDYEFIEIFDRLSRIVNFGRCRSPEDIENSIKRVQKIQKKAYQTAKKRSTVRKYRSDYIHLRTLRRHGISDRIWEEAVRNPGGIVELTLLYGRENARKKLLERERRRRGRMRRIR